MNQHTRHFIRIKKVQDRVGLARSTIYAKIKVGEFPPPYPLGKRAAGWLSSDIDTWIDNKIMSGRETAQLKNLSASNLK